MTPFDQKFIENPEFLKWIFNTNPDIVTYWEQYQVEHPEEKTQLLDLKNRLSELKFSNNSMHPIEKKELACRITNRIDNEFPRNKWQTFLYASLKYAAVALIFFGFGGLWVYLKTDKEFANQEFARQTIEIPSNSLGPMLITSNGKNVDLKASNSTVDYSRSGTVVLNNDSILEITADLPDVMNQLVIPYGNQSRVVLSDNTVVLLNAGSRLIYPTLFKEKIRAVTLFGEAYFEVSKNAEKPFVVKTSDLKIRVLGTKFNVSAYAEDGVIQTVLKEGSVAIRRNGAGYFENDIIIKPNQMVSFDKTSRDSKIYEVDSDSYTFWTKGMFSFEEVDFSRVIKKIERFYNISINFSDRQKEIMRISGKLHLKQSRKEVIEYLEKVSLSKFEQISENQYVIK